MCHFGAQPYFFMDNVENDQQNVKRETKEQEAFLI
jgi:hypothetical protein